MPDRPNMGFGYMPNTEVLFALARIGNQEAIDILFEFLDGNNCFVSDALSALEEIGRPIVPRLLQRLTDEEPVLWEAAAWRDAAGRSMLEAVWEALDGDVFVEAVEQALDTGADPFDLEEALFEVDELAAAAAWCGREDQVRPVSAKVAEVIRARPGPFDSLTSDAADTVQLPEVAADPDLYAFWWALAQLPRV